MKLLQQIWNGIQKQLFPALEEFVGPLTKKEKHLVEVLSLIDFPAHMAKYKWRGKGRRKRQRIKIARAFSAKAIYNLPTTDMLIELLIGSKNLRFLCGWENSHEVPSKATFSRAFADFADGGFCQEVFETTIKKHCSDKVAGHVSRDSTSITAREKPAKKEKKVKHKRKPGRPRKGEKVEPKLPKRLDVQPKRTLEENLKDLPVICDRGTKKNSKGFKTTWIGYSLHLDCIDGDIPVSAVLTSASLHDSQVAIPLSQMTGERLTNFYDLMDSAYDAVQIKDFSRQSGHVPIIDHNPRKGEKIQMEPAVKQRYKERSTVERVNGYLKDNYGGKQVRVKGGAKVFTHLLFGVMAIAATQLLKMVV